MNEEIKSLIKRIATNILQDAYTDDLKLYEKLRKAYNFYQNQECNDAGRVYDFSNIEDLKTCADCLGDRYKLQAILNESIEKHNDFFRLDYDEKRAWLVGNFRDVIANSALEIATCVVYYPHDDYKPLYDFYVSDSMTSECDARYIAFLEFAQS